MQSKNRGGAMKYLIVLLMLFMMGCSTVKRADVPPSYYEDAVDSISADDLTTYTYSWSIYIEHIESIRFEDGYMVIETKEEDKCQYTN